MKINPFIKPQNSNVSFIMADVILALLPLAGAACFAYGFHAFYTIAATVTAALTADFLFSFLYLKKKPTL